MHDNLAQLRQRGHERFPDPHCESFAGWIFQAGNVVEATMIQLFEHRRECSFDFGEIHDPTCVSRRFAAHMHFDAKRMTMHA